MNLIKKLFADPLFLRICTLLFGVPLVALPAVILFAPGPRLDSWLVVFLMVIGLLGVVLVGAALVGDDRSVDGAATAASADVSESALVFYILIAVLAVPLTLALRQIWPTNDQP